MDANHLISRYSALRHQLACAYAELPWQRERIDRIADDLVETERALTAVQSLSDGQMRFAPMPAPRAAS